MPSLARRIFRTRESRLSKSATSQQSDPKLEHPEFRRPGTVLQLMGSLGLNRGGLTRAVYERTRELGKDRRTVIASLAHQFDYQEVFEKTIEAGLLPTHAELRDFHGDIQRNGRVGNPEVTELSKLIDDGVGIGGGHAGS